MEGKKGFRKSKIDTETTISEKKSSSNRQKTHAERADECTELLMYHESSLIVSHREKILRTQNLDQKKCVLFRIFNGKTFGAIFINLSIKSKYVLVT